MRLSGEAKLGLLATFGTAAGGALVPLFPTQTWIGWSVLALSLIGAIAVGLHHLWWVCPWTLTWLRQHRLRWPVERKPPSDRMDVVAPIGTSITLPASPNQETEESLRRKRALIKGGRRLVYLFMQQPPENRHDGVFKAGVEKSVVYYEIEPYLSQKFKSDFFSRVTFVPSATSTIPYLARSFLYELERLEHEWELAKNPPAASPPSPSPPASPIGR